MLGPDMSITALSIEFSSANTYLSNQNTVPFVYFPKRYSVESMTIYLWQERRTVDWKLVLENLSVEHLSFHRRILVP
jgi:hypothetical protein